MLFSIFSLEKHKRNNVCHRGLLKKSEKTSVSLFWYFFGEHNFIQSGFKLSYCVFVLFREELIKFARDLRTAEPAGQYKYYHKKNQYWEAHDRLLFGSHETSPIKWIGKLAPAMQC